MLLISRYRLTHNDLYWQEFYPYSLANMIHTCPVSAFQARTLAAEIVRTFSSTVHLIIVIRAQLIGIEELHALGILHCDLKPDNILISQKGHAVVADFGLCERARLIPGVTAKLPRLIASRGTEGYMAPEVLRKFDTWSGPADLWAFGCILYDLHIGRDDVSCHKSRAIRAATDMYLQPFFLHGRWPEARQSITATLAFRPDFAYMSWLLGDRDVADLICQLWHPLPKERPTIARIKAHPYFRRM
jgi:serine/threonine protein kinase